MCNTNACLYHDQLFAAEYVTRLCPWAATLALSVGFCATRANAWFAATFRQLGARFRVVAFVLAAANERADAPGSLVDMVCAILARFTQRLFSSCWVTATCLAMLRLFG